MSLGAWAWAGFRARVFRIGHLGDFNDLTLMPARSSGVEMGLAAVGVPHRKGGTQAALDYLASPEAAGVRRAA
jgi:alanine-glyoxylate transaminase/serine-glyoxylate transaminase/serine-pyruvate transaminase